MTNPAAGPTKLGSGNYLKDRGYSDPAEMRVKFLLSNEIALAIEDKVLSQKAAAELTNLKQPDISRIVNGNVGDYSVWRLMRALSLLGRDIVIDIHQSSQARGDINTNISPTKQVAGR
jgi:predicted XRE-type DNA-binding protein